MKIYVNCNQPFPGMGTKACPFSTIQQAADAAMPGDEVLVVDCQASATPKKTSKGVRQPNLLRGL